MEFIMDNLEIVVAIVGGLSFGGVMFVSKYKSNENDLTQLYIKHKKHSDNINKSAKSTF